MLFGADSIVLVKKCRRTIFEKILKLTKNKKIAIIGAGVSGLVSAALLSKNGYAVSLFEKESKIGGCLQTFVRNGITFDTGMHYAGSLGEGEPLHKVFSYLEVANQLNLRQMDLDGFDRFMIDEKIYSYPQGFNRFEETFSNYFPNEKDNIKSYLNEVKTISETVPLFGLRYDENPMKTVEYEIGLGREDDFIKKHTKNQKLQNLLGAQGALVGAENSQAFLYIHALIKAHFLQSAWRFVDGTSQLADALRNVITKNGGEIFAKSKVEKVSIDNGNITSLTLDNGDEFQCDSLISTIHPSATIKLLPDDAFRKVYRKRLLNLENTSGVFSLYLELKDFPYMNYNLYNGKVSFLPLATSHDNGKTRAASVIIPEKWSNLAEWENTKVGNRGDKYLLYKAKQTEEILSNLEQMLPGIKSKIVNIHSSSSLSWRDYTGTPNGSIYGALKNADKPMQSLVMPFTKIKNLFLSGQSVGMHGLYGTTFGSIVNCRPFLNFEKMLNEINNV